MTTRDRSAPPLPSFIALEDEPEAQAPSKFARVNPAEASPINVELVDRNINESLRKQIVDIINKNQYFALSVIRSWKDRKD